MNGKIICGVLYAQIVAKRLVHVN